MRVKISPKKGFKKSQNKSAKKKSKNRLNYLDRNWHISGVFFNPFGYNCKDWMNQDNHDKRNPILINQDKQDNN